MKIKLFVLVTLLILTMLIVAACSSSSSTDIANPASEYCVEQGGTAVIEERGDGGQYGVCTFEENRQCEEWAMMRGDCPVGGIRVTGYVTDAARFCAISGGSYEVTGTDDSGEEQGTCTLPDGKSCDVWDYYNGECPAGSG